MKKVNLLTYGDGSPGDEWGVISIHSTRELAKEAQKKYEPAINVYGKPYKRQSEIEEWLVNEAA